VGVAITKPGDNLVFSVAKLFYYNRIETRLVLVKGQHLDVFTEGEVLYNVVKGHYAQEEVICAYCSKQVRQFASHLPIHP